MLAMTRRVPLRADRDYQPRPLPVGDSSRCPGGSGGRDDLCAQPWRSRCSRRALPSCRRAPRARRRCAVSRRRRSPCRPPPCRLEAGLGIASARRRLPISTRRRGCRAAGGDSLPWPTPRTRRSRRGRGKSVRSPAARASCTAPALDHVLDGVRARPQRLADLARRRPSRRARPLALHAARRDDPAAARHLSAWIPPAALVQPLRRGCRRPCPQGGRRLDHSAPLSGSPRGCCGVDDGGGTSPHEVLRGNAIEVLMVDDGHVAGNEALDEVLRAPAEPRRPRDDPLAAAGDCHVHRV